MKTMAALRLVGNIVGIACQIVLVALVVTSFASSWRWLVFVPAALVTINFYRGASLARRALTSTPLDAAAE